MKDLNVTIQILKDEFLKKLGITNGLNGKDGLDGSPDNGKEIVSKINDLGEKDEKIDAKHIKNLPPTVLRRGGGGGIAEIIAGSNITAERHGNKVTIASTASGTGSATTPGGSDTQVQFNDSGSFGGDAGLTYNKTTNVLTINTIPFGKGTGTDSVQIGPSATAVGDYTYALGETANAVGYGAVAIGAGAAATNATGESVAIGLNSTSSSLRGVRIGASGTVSGEQAVGIGYASNVSGFGGLAIGADTTANANYAIAIGNAAVGLYDYGISLGKDAATYAANQMVIGPDVDDGSGINELYLGQGRQSTAQYHFAMKVTRRQGVNKTGNNFTLATGNSTGTGVGGDFIIQTSDAGASGSTLGTLTNKFLVKGNGLAHFIKAGNTFAAILDAVNIATSDKTFTFPNTTGTIALEGLAGTKVYYVSDTSGGAVTRKLTFTNGILTAET